MPSEQADTADVLPPNNREVSAALVEIADLLEISGESSFKVGAYRRAANSVARSPVDVAMAYRDGEPPKLNGVGASISERIGELASTGTMAYLDELRTELPTSLMSLLAVPGIGPRTAGEVWRRLGIATLSELEAAARGGRLRSIRGINERTEARIVEGIAEIERHPPRRMSIREAHDLAAAVIELISALPHVVSATIAGSVRRGRETVGDLDVLVESEEPETVIASLAATAAIENGLEIGMGGHDRASLQLKDGPQLDILTLPPGTMGSYLVHLTGSAEHNVKLRHLAKDRGWSLSERGISIGVADEEVGAGAGADVRTFAAESDVYDALGLAWIEPALREDRGEVEAAASGELPELVTRADLRGDCHSHSHWSDGRDSLETMVESARRMGHAYLVLSDHSQSLTIANGLTPDRVEAQRRIIGELNERFARDAAAGLVPEGADAGFRLLHGCELEITTDARLDYEDTLLASFDVVLASLHVGRRQPRARLMERYELAMRSPHVDIITHPSGRKIGRRPDLDLDWEAFYRLAAETGTLLEINGSEDRLDLDEDRVRAALDAGCSFTIDSDAHDREEWRNLDWGVAVARRGWVSPADVANTLELEPFVALMTEKPHRV